MGRASLVLVVLLVVWGTLPPYRSSTGEWLVRPSGAASPWQVTFGQVGDVPLVVR